MDFLSLIFAFLILLFLAIFGYSFTLAFIKFAPFLPSNKASIKAIIENLPPKQYHDIADLGAGDMSLLIALEKHFKIPTDGFEFSPFPYLLGKLKLYFTKSQSKIYYQDFFKTNLSKYDLIFTYLTPKTLTKLSAKISAECSPNTLIISNRFTIPNLNLIKTITLANLSHNIYIYKTKIHPTIDK